MHLLLLTTTLFYYGSFAFNARRDALSDCLAGGNVPILMTTSPLWSEAIEPFNLRLQPSPNIVAIPRNNDEVRRAMRCAATTNTKVSVKGGGHSYGAYGLSGVLVLDMSEFQTITLNPATKHATVGAGVRLGNMAKRIYNLGKRALPHGTCAGVGIGGHATLGGFGLDSRLWGLTLDVVESMRVVTADGKRILTASAIENSELFWGLRGAGASNFGVVTEFRLKTFPAPAVNTHWSYEYNFAESGKLAQALRAVQEWGKEFAPKELGFGFLIFPGALVVRGVYYGQRSAFEPLIAPLLENIRPIYDYKEPRATIQVLGWLDSLVALNGGPLETPVKGYDAHDTFYAKSLAVPESRPISIGAASSLTAYLYNVPTSADWIIITNLYGGPDSAINKIPANGTSYRHRSSGYVWQFYASGGPAANIVQYVKDMVGAMGNEIDGYPAYAPYADPELADPQTAYWGENVGRLRELKKKWDRDDVLLNPQGF